MMNNDEIAKECASTACTALEAPTDLSPTHSGGNSSSSWRICASLVFEDQEKALLPQDEEKIVEFDIELTNDNFQ